MKTIDEVNNYLVNRVNALAKDLETFQNNLLVVSGEGDPKAIREARDNVLACRVRLDEVRFFYTTLNIAETKEAKVEPTEVPEA